MAYKPPGTYARFVKTASPVATAGGSRVMALVGTGINYYTIYNEAVTKSNTKPYDELKNDNVFEVLNVSSRPIYNNIITSDNIVYNEHSESNKGYKVNDNIISWDSLSEAECKIDSSFCPRFVYHQGEGVVTNNITASIDENALIPVEDGNWMIEVSYINEEDEDLKPGSKMGCYRVINLLTGEIVGEYAVSPDPVTNEDGSYPIPGILLTVNDTYIKEDGEQKVFVGDYIKITTVAAKTEIEAKVYKQMASIDNKFNLTLNVNENKTIDDLIETVDLTWNDIVGDNDKYVIYAKTSPFNSNNNEMPLLTGNEYVIPVNYNENNLTITNEDILKIIGEDEKREKVFNFNVEIKEKTKNEKVKHILSLTLVDEKYNKDFIYEYSLNDEGYVPFTSNVNITKDNREDYTNIIIKVYHDINGEEFDVYSGEIDLTLKNDDEFINSQSTNVIYDKDTFNSSTYNENTKLYFLLTSIDINENVVDFAISSENYDEEANDNTFTSKDASIFYNAINNLTVISNDTLYEKTAVYMLTYKKPEDKDPHILITRIVNGEIDNTFKDKRFELDVEDYFEDIPGINFEIDTTQLIDLDDNVKTYIVTSPRVISNEIPSEGNTYYVSYKYRKTESDYEPKYFTDYDDIVATYGNYDVSASSAILNSLSLGAEIAFNNGVSSIVCVQSKNNSDYEMQAAIDKLTSAIAGANNVNTVIPLTTSSVVGSYLKNHVDLMSSYEYGKERMGYLAGYINQPINKIATKNDRSLGLSATAEGYSDERIVYVVPGAIKKSIRDLRTGKYNERVLPGCYAAVAVAAVGLSNDPAEPLTNKTIAGFTELVDFYNESEKNALAASGCCVLEHSGSTIKIRHGITTSTGEVNSQEITLIQIKDYVIDSCRTTTAGLYIGRKLTASIISDVQYTMESMLNNFVSQGIIIGYSSLNVKRNSEEPRQIDVSFEIEAVYPLNWISIEFGFSSVG